MCAHEDLRSATEWFDEQREVCYHQGLLPHEVIHSDFITHREARGFRVQLQQRTYSCTHRTHIERRGENNDKDDTALVSINLSISIVDSQQYILSMMMMMMMKKTVVELESEQASDIERLGQMNAECAEWLWRATYLVARKCDSKKSRKRMDEEMADFPRIPDFQSSRDHSVT